MSPLPGISWVFLAVKAHELGLEGWAGFWQWWNKIHILCQDKILLCPSGPPPSLLVCIIIIINQTSLEDKLPSHSCDGSWWPTTHFVCTDQDYVSCQSNCDLMYLYVSGRPGVLQSMGSQRVSYDWTTEGEVAQWCPTLCNPMNCSLPASSIHGIFQARILEWFAISFSRGSSWPRDWTWVFHIAGRLFTIWATRESLTGQLNNNKCLKNLYNCALTSDGQNSP